jgi:hypothetical protein
VGREIESPGVQEGFECCVTCHGRSSQLEEIGAMGREIESLWV